MAGYGLADAMYDLNKGMEQGQDRKFQVEQRQKDAEFKAESQARQRQDWGLQDSDRAYQDERRKVTDQRADETWARQQELWKDEDVKRAYDNSLVTAKKALQAFEMSGGKNTQGLIDWYNGANNYNDGVDIEDVQVGQDGSYSVAFSNGQKMRLKDMDAVRQHVFAAMHPDQWIEVRAKALQKAAEPISVADGTDLIDRTGRVLYQNKKDKTGGITMTTPDGSTVQIGGNSPGGFNIPSGYRMKDTNRPWIGLEPIPGGPADDMSPGDAAKVSLIEQGRTDAREAAGIILGKDGKVDRMALAQMETRAPFTKGRTLYSMIYNSVEGKLRAESGAAVPEAEVTRIAQRFVPSLMDDDETIKSKLQRLDEYLGATMDKVDPTARFENRAAQQPGRVNLQHVSDDDLLRALGVQR